MKKSKWTSFNFNLEVKTDAVLKENIRCKKKQVRSINKNVLPSPKNRDFNFEKQLEPHSLIDLAVHPKKVKEVESWIEHNVIKSNKQNKTSALLIISGPTGSGKTTTVRVICEQFSIHIAEWLNPIDQDYELYRGPSQITRFSEFLTESKWNSLSVNSDKKIILVKDFPNAVMRNPDEFATVLEDCYYKSRCPVVFICTDSYDNGVNISQNLFPKETIKKYGIFEISFNAVAITLLKSALKRAQSLVQENTDLFKIPSSSTIDAIVSTSLGDIRSAMNQYYFASLLGSAELPQTTTLNKVGLKRKRNENKTAIKSMARDENLGIFHGLGRVLNPKTVKQDGKLVFIRDIGKIVDEFSIQPSTFVSLLFENYLSYFGEANDIYQAANLFSFIQTFNDNSFDKYEITVNMLWMCIVGLMLCNRHKVSKWNQIRAITKTKRPVNTTLETRHLSATDMFYYNIITGKNAVAFGSTCI